MGKRIVITSFGSYGDVYPYMGLALGLKARGHDPVLAMPAHYRDTVEGDGLSFRPVRPDVDPTDRDLVRQIMDPSRGTAFIVKTLILGSLRDSFGDLGDVARGADLLITHPVTFAGPLVAEDQGLRWMSTVLAPMSFFSPHDLPVFPPIPWTKPLGRIPGVASGLVGIARRATRGWGEPVHAMRNQLGLPAGGHPVYEGQHSPHGVLALFSRVLADPQPDWPGRVHITGAIPYNGAGGNESSLAPEVEAFLEAGPPPVVFTLGSSAVGAAGTFYEESLGAARRVGVRAILLVGSHPGNLPREELMDDVLVLRSAPHAALFPRASVVVHQGGAGTLHQGLRSGRPTLVVPFAHDQPDNAHRVQRLKVSRTLRPKRYTANRVAGELRILMEDEGYRSRAADLAEQVRAEDAVRSACDAVEKVLDAPARRSRGG